MACMTNPLRADRREKGNCSRAPRSDARGPFSRREKEQNREAETATHRPFLASRVGGRNPRRKRKSRDASVSAIPKTRLLMRGLGAPGPCLRDSLWATIRRTWSSRASREQMIMEHGSLPTVRETPLHRHAVDQSQGVAVTKRRVPS